MSDLAIIAARNALERAKLTPNDIDAYIVATVMPDYPFPATAALVATALGAVEKAAFDMEIACSGFVYGLGVASSLVRAGVHKRVMIIGAETLSKITDYSDRSTAILFGDGAGAAIIERCEKDCFLGSEFGTDGSRPEVLYLPVGGSRRQIDAAALDERQNYLKMRGSETFKFAVTKMVESSQSVLRQAGVGVEDVRLLIPHQANKRIIDAAAKQLGIAGDRVYINIQDYGNTSAASIPIALSEAYEKKMLAHDDLIVFVAFGGGLSWGAIAWRWDEKH